MNEPADVPKFLVNSARNDSGTNKGALVRLERAIAEIATENTNMAMERSEFAPKARVIVSDATLEVDREINRIKAQGETAEQAVAGWIVSMPYTDLKMICIGLQKHAHDKPPMTYQDFVELLHTWAVNVVDPPQQL